MKKDFSLWDKTRFERLEAERVKHLQRLKIEEGIKIMEFLLNSGLDREFRRIKKEFTKNGV
jgi:putative ubiquitin-RnfH superfamily antitoxin RatB of RatAB toxin-antitoxin module